jgi:hypothetical protein
LRGLGGDCGDLILASAGSAGRAEGVYSSQPNPARLWPSFNLVDLTDQRVRVEALSFSPKNSRREPVRRDLIHVRREGPKWTPLPISFDVSDVPSRIARDDAAYALSPSQGSSERWDFTCERRVQVKDGAKLRRYKDFSHALPPLLTGSQPKRRTYRRVELSLDGPTEHRATDALCRTLNEAERRYGRGTAFEWVGLLCRYGADIASLSLRAPSGALVDPFASATDLTTGRERPAQLELKNGVWTVTVPHCVPRTLLRVYWPLATD